jgi:hypothetical protein
LAALAACHLGDTCYPQLVKLANALAPPGTRADFVLACDHVRTALDGANRARQDLGNQPLGEADILIFIKQLVQVAVRRRRVPLTGTGQEQQIKVNLFRKPEG